MENKPIELTEDEQKGVSLLTSLTRKRSHSLDNSSNSIFSSASLENSLLSSMDIGLSSGMSSQKSPLQPRLSPTLVTIRKDQLLAYIQRYGVTDRPFAMNSSKVFITIPVPTSSTSYQLYQRPCMDVSFKPMGALVSPVTNEPMGLLIPTSDNKLNIPTSLIEPVSPAEKFYIYNVSLPIQG